MAINLLIDTDVLIDYLREQGDAVRYLESMQDKPLISVITVTELYAGVREGKERKRLDKFISAFEVVLVDLNISVKGGLLNQGLIKDSIQLPTALGKSYAHFTKNKQL